MTAVVPTAHITAPLALAARKCGYRIFKAPASGPAKIRSSAMKRPKNTAQTPHRAKSCLASATCPGPKCLGKRLPRRSNSDIPKRRPIEYPIVSPTIAPMVAAVATPTGLMSGVWRGDKRGALTSAISPGNGMPRLSMPMTVPTMRYTASGGTVCRKPSMSTALTMPLVGVRRVRGEVFRAVVAKGGRPARQTPSRCHGHQSHVGYVVDYVEFAVRAALVAEVDGGLLQEHGPSEAARDERPHALHARGLMHDERRHAGSRQNRPIEGLAG